MNLFPRVCRLSLSLAATVLFLTMAANGFARADTPPASGAPPAASAPAPAGGFDATIDSIKENGNLIYFNLNGQPSRAFAVPDAASRATLKFAEAGDIAKIVVDNASAPTAIKAITEVDRPVPFGPRFVTFAIAFVVLFLIACLVTWGKPMSLLVGADNRYSNSQVQLALWFGAVAAVYSAALWLRLDWLGGNFIGGVGLTTNLVALTGLSAFSFGGAKVITAQKVAAAALPPANGAPAPAKKTRGTPNLLRDLFQNDDQQADLGDVQMIMITIAAVVIFVASAFHFLGSLQLATPVTLPDVDTTLLAGFGLGQGAYLLKKAALPLGQG